jgi:hypothetical protein
VLVGALSLTALSLAFSAEQSQSIVIANYQFTGTSLAPTTSDANVSASNVNFTGSNASQFSLDNILVVNAATGATNATTAVSNNSFFAFTVTPNPLVSLALTSLDFQTAAGNANFTSDGYVVRSSVDSFGSDLSSGFYTTPFPTFASTSVNLTAPSFQAITAPVTFRVYTFRGGGSIPTATAAYDNLTLNGTATPVPFESDALPVVGSAAFMAGGLWWKRRRGQAKVTDFIAQK